MKKLSAEEIESKLGKINNWVFNNNEISKSFELIDFADSLAFTLKVGIEAEKLDHHPNIFIHEWNKVKISISSHDVGGITENDFILAKKIDGIKK